MVMTEKKAKNAAVSISPNQKQPGNNFLTPFQTNLINTVETMQWRELILTDCSFTSNFTQASLKSSPFVSWHLNL